MEAQTLHPAVIARISLLLMNYIPTNANEEAVIEGAGKRWVTTLQP